MEDLWENYISIEELGNNRDLENYLKSYSIDYNTWPADIKHNFRRLINGTRDTMVYKLKEEIDEKYSEINDLLKELYSLNKKLNELDGKGKGLIKNSNKLANYLLEKIFPYLGLITLANGINGCLDKNTLNNKDNICKKDENYKNESIKKIINGYLSLFQENENNSLNTTFNVDEKKKSITNLFDKIKDKIKNNKVDVVCGIHTFLSFLNLCWSIYNLYNLIYHKDKINECIDKYEEKLNIIIINFNRHVKEIGLLPENFLEASLIIQNVLSKIIDDQRDLKNLFEEISAQKKLEEDKKNRSIFGIGFSILSTIFGFGGLFYQPAKYAFSTTCNILSLIIHTKNYKDQKILIDKLNEILDKIITEAQNNEKKINELIHKLREKKFNELPNFGNSFKVI